MNTTIGKTFEGVWYNELMWSLSRKRNTQRYLEIGVRNGRLLRGIKAEIAVGVDPSFEIDCNVMQDKKTVHLLRQTSDEFFADYARVVALLGQPDLVFLDGMHLFEFLLRDFYNSEKICSTSSLIAVHDCLPRDGIMIDRSEERARISNEQGKFKDWWTGDLWKFIKILRKYRPGLQLVIVDSPPTGVLFITNLDPGSTFLKENYLDVVREFHEIPNTIDQLEEFYKDINLTKAESLLNEDDHSLYLRM